MMFILVLAWRCLDDAQGYALYLHYSLSTKSNDLLSAIADDTEAFSYWIKGFLMTSMAARTSAERDYQILIVDDDQMVQQLYAGLLARQAARPCTIHQAASGGAGLAALQAQTFDCVLLDFRLPDMNGLDFLACSAVDGVLPCAFVLVTAQGSEATAVEAMKRGVQDYLVKGLMDLGHLWNVLERATTEVRLRQKLAQTTRDLEHRSAELASLNGALGRSEARFRSLVEAAPNAFAMINADGRIKMVNAQTERLFGYSRTELLGVGACNHRGSCSQTEPDPARIS